MTYTQKIKWADAHDLNNLRLFNALDRYGFFDPAPSILIGYDFLSAASRGNIRNIGLKSIAEFETVIRLMECE